MGRTPPAILDSHNCPVAPQSLYAVQLAERATFGSQPREYWLGDIDDLQDDGATDIPYIDAAWWSAWTDAGQPLIGFDDPTPGAVVPFSFQLNLNPGDVVVDARLTLALRAVGPGADAGSLYLGSLDNAYAFADLGWDPPSADETSVRVAELSALGDFFQTGRLDVAISGDTAIDWAMLTVRVTSGAMKHN